MRRTVILAVSAAALILPQAATAKPPAQTSSKELVYYTVTLQAARIVDGHVTTGAGKQLQVESWQWASDTSRSAGGHSMLGASDRVRVAGPRTDEPQGGGPGSLIVKGRYAGCTVGQRYGGMQFAANGMRYELKDVVISNCPASVGPKEEITFVYGTVIVRGWDPEKKEQ